MTELEHPCEVCDTMTGESELVDYRDNWLCAECARNVAVLNAIDDEIDNPEGD